MENLNELFGQPNRFTDKVNVYICEGTLLSMEHCCGENKCKVRSLADHDLKIYQESWAHVQTMQLPHWQYHNITQQGASRGLRANKRDPSWPHSKPMLREFIHAKCRRGERKREGGKSKKRQPMKQDKREKSQEPKKVRCGGKKKTIPPGSGALVHYQPGLLLFSR